MTYKFTKRIEIVELTEGGFMPGESTEQLVTKAWADIKTMKGSEFTVYKSTENLGTSRFVIRYQDGIEPSMKVKYKGQTYDIESIVNDDEQNRTLTIIGNTVL